MDDNQLYDKPITDEASLYNHDIENHSKTFCALHYNNFILKLQQKLFLWLEPACSTFLCVNLII